MATLSSSFELFLDMQVSVAPTPVSAICNMSWMITNRHQKRQSNTCHIPDGDIHAFHYVIYYLALKEFERESFWGKCAPFQRSCLVSLGLWGLLGLLGLKGLMGLLETHETHHYQLIEGQAVFIGSNVKQHPAINAPSLVTWISIDLICS